MAVYTDNFNRADNDDLGAPWVASTAGNSISILSNRLVCDNPIIGGISGRSERYEASIGAAQYSQAVLTDVDANSFGAVGVRIHFDGGSGTVKGYYYGRVVIGGGNEDHRLIKDNDMNATIASATYPTAGSFGWSVTKTLKIQAFGNTIKCYVNGLEALSGINGDYPTGAPGFGCPGGISGSITGFDDWEGGDIPSDLYFDPSLGKRRLRLIQRRSHVFKHYVDP